MADFSLTTLFVVPTSQTALPATDSISTQDLTAGQVGIFAPDYKATTTPGSEEYFYIAQGRENTYLQGTKRSDKIKGCGGEKGGKVVVGVSSPCNSNVTEWYKVGGCGTPTNQIIQIKDWTAKCGDVITITLRAHSAYLDSLYFNGLTRSVTVQVPCCECGEDPCTEVDCDTLLDLVMEKLTGYNVTDGVIDWTSPISTAEVPDDPFTVSLNTYFTFSKVTVGDDDCVLQIEGKPLTKFGVPCDVAAFPHEYDRMWFRAFVYNGPATTADFLVTDACEPVATVTTVQNSTYATGTYEEIKQLEIDYHSYQAGYLKHLYRWAGYNQNFESWAESGKVYDTFYIKFNEYFRGAYNWGDYVPRDSMVIIAAEAGSAFSAALETALETALGTVTADNVCITTTSTTTAALTTTTTTAALTTTTTTER
jgi:hypothetical protein